MATVKAFIGTANWDIFLHKDSGSLSAIPKPGNSASKSGYGDKHHVKKLMEEGYFADTPTEAGLELLEGLYSVLPQELSIHNNKTWLKWA